MTRGDIRYLKYIRESIQRVQRWAAPGLQAVLADEVLFEAILRRLETLPDAASQLSEEDPGL